MKKLLVSLLLAVFAAAAYADPVERIKGLGKDRENLSAQMLADRTVAIMDALEFWILRNPAMQEAPARIFEKQMWHLIQTSAANEGLEALDLAALIAIESQGRPYVKSPTGPLGICQFSKALAIDLGLVKVEMRRRTKQVTQGKGKNRKTVTKPYGKAVPYVVTDRRVDVNYAIPACAKWLARGIKTYGSLDFAIQRHHNGDARVLKILSLYTGQTVTSANAAEIVRKNNLGMPKIFFDNTPYHRPALYAYLEKIRREADSAPGYFLRVKAARRLLEVYVKDPRSYASLYQSYRTGFKPDGVAPSRMWYFYTPEQVTQMQFADLVAIQEARGKGRLVSLPRPWRQFGFEPRLTGKSPIGEKDLRNQDSYTQAEASTVGALLYIMNEVRLLQGKSFAPYEVNSLVRSTAYQGVLKASNGNAKTLLPTHTIGKAFDLPMKGISAARRRDMLFILSDLDANGMISYIPEGSQDTIHVVPHPQWESFFERYYQQQAVNVRVANEGSK